MASFTVMYHPFIHLSSGALVMVYRIIVPKYGMENVVPSRGMVSVTMSAQFGNLADKSN